jgi:hypothetical protein
MPRLYRAIEKMAAAAGYTPAPFRYGYGTIPLTAGQRRAWLGTLRSNGYSQGANPAVARQAVRISRHAFAPSLGKTAAASMYIQWLRKTGRA